MKFARALRWFLLGLLIAVSVDAVAQYTVVGRAAYRLFVGSTELLGVRALVLPSGTTCDGGTCTLGGGANDPPGCAVNNLQAASNDGGARKCVNLTINADNSLTFADGTNFSGPIWNLSKTKIDGFPDAVVAQASVSPQDRDAGGIQASGFVPQRFKATGGYTYNGDAYVMPNAGCSVSVPNNQTLRYEVQFHGTKEPGIDAANIPTGSCWVRRKYEITNANGTITVSVLQSEADTGGCGPGAGTGYQIDGGGAGAPGVVSPVFVGVAATQIRVECEVVDWYVTSNP